MAKRKSKNSSLISGIIKGKFTAGATRQQINARPKLNLIARKSSREK
ncbi:MAG: hypothetical protein IPM32_18250 [Ignavibacteriae bacterium]|nr:hypothetical protein [Ignavibacteriota bacterium]